MMELWQSKCSLGCVCMSEGCVQTFRPPSISIDDRHAAGAACFFLSWACHAGHTRTRSLRLPRETKSEKNEGACGGNRRNKAYLVLLRKPFRKGSSSETHGQTKKNKEQPRPLYSTRKPPACWLKPALWCSSKRRYIPSRVMCFRLWRVMYEMHLQARTNKAPTVLCCCMMVRLIGIAQIVWPGIPRRLD